MTRRAAALLFAILISSAALAQQQAIPTPDEFLGYKLGQYFTPYVRIRDYFTELTRRSPLITFQQIGQTYEGRPLNLAVITSARNRAALETIRANVAALGSGDGIDAARAANITHTSPAIVWLAFGVHGNETSSSEAAMRVASTLLRDQELAELLDNLVIIIDPLQNPDGRERYVQWFRRSSGAEPNVNPDAAEHQEPWPGGRYNHYLIDMNRDWTWMSQRETKARVAAYQRWYPQVFVDFHEMGVQSTYFFPPDATPLNVNLPQEVEKWLEVFGRANAEAFSRRAWPFFVAERYDLFYPGYGDSWPSLHGAVGMTYEVSGGGRGGVAVEREDGSVLTLADRIDRHYTTAMTTLRTASANREALLKYTYDSMRAGIDKGKNTYLVLPDSPSFTTLVETLRAQGVRISTLTAPMSLRATRIDRNAVESHNFPAGTAVITTRQPLGGLVETLLERRPELNKSFMDEQRAKAEADEPDDFYDLTTWSMPLAMNVDTYVTTAAVTASIASWSGPAAVAAISPASYGYLISGLDPNIYRVVGRLVRADVRFSVADAALAVGDQTYPRGTIVILKGNNDPTIDATVSSITNEFNTPVVSLSSGWLGGTSFGTEKLHFVKKPKIGLIGGVGTDATSFGMLWHTLDVDTPIPHSTITAETLRNIDLSRYNVLVMPDGTYNYGKREAEKLQTWLRNGGTLIAIKRASVFLRDKDVEISKLKPWEPPKKKDDKETTAPAQDERYNEYRVPGSAFRTVMNERSYLTFGVPRPPAVLIEGSAAFVPVTHRVDNIVTVENEDPLVSGVAWPESLERIKGSVYLVSEPYGKGSVITFADEPHFRLFWRATLPLFLNAVVYSPSFPR